VRVRDLYGVREAVMVTQSFHLPRTIALARTAGIDAVGVGDRSMSARRRSTVIGYAREAGASGTALRDALLRPAPAHTELCGALSRRPAPRRTFFRFATRARDGIIGTMNATTGNDANDVPSGAHDVDWAALAPEGGDRIPELLDQLTGSDAAVSDLHDIIHFPAPGHRAAPKAVDFLVDIAC